MITLFELLLAELRRIVGLFLSEGLGFWRFLRKDDWE